ncbi:MAG: family 16 glycoside hydrolase [Planctomycetota bacterium]|nr:family 16 glycoside hydrolase [Planctomycetota bacterium]
MTHVIAQESSLERHEYRQIVMGVEARIAVYAEDASAARLAAAAAFSRMEELDAVMSDYRADSELIDFCARATQEPMRISQELWDVFELSTSIWEASEGAFDPTVGPIVDLWRVAKRDGRSPTEEEIKKAQSRVGWDHVVMDLETRTASLKSEGMRIDLGGIGKGFAADIASQTLFAAGLPRHLVDVGGDLMVGDPPPGRRGWTVSAGCGEGEAGPRRLVVSRQAVATTGDTVQGALLEGVPRSHLMDPSSGQAMSDRLCVTVLAERCAVADALSTAVRVLGRRKGRILVSQFDGARLLIEDHSSQPLFDGETLEGWVTTGGRYDGAALWTVEGGVLVGRTGPEESGGLLYTEKSYTAFALELEVKIDEPFDSGVFLRMVPEAKGAQITLDARPDGEIGGVYSEGWLQHNPEGWAHWRRHEWNHLEIICTGFDFHLQTWLNGHPLADYLLPAESRGFSPSGRIGLQVHGGGSEGIGNQVEFRDLHLTELSVFGSDALNDEKGWENLLGEGLSQWMVIGEAEDVAVPDAYRLKEGILEIPKGGEDPGIRTRALYRDFQLSMEFQQSTMCNSGLFLRADPNGGNPAYSGCEIQILDDHNWESVTETTLQPWQFTGSLYGAMAPAVSILRPIGEWNRFEAVYQDDRLAVALNGQTLYDVITTELDVQPAFSERVLRGFIGLQRYGSSDTEGDVALWVKNLFIKPLD